MLAKIITNFTSIYTKIPLLYHGHRRGWTDGEREKERERGGQEILLSFMGSYEREISETIYPYEKNELRLVKKMFSIKCV